MPERVNPVGVVEMGIDPEDLTDRRRGCILQKYQSRKTMGYDMVDFPTLMSNPLQHAILFKPHE